MTYLRLLFFRRLGVLLFASPFLPPRVDAETRCRRALDELQAAKQEVDVEAHARDALCTEIERIKRERASQVQAKEVLGQRERALRAPTAFDRVHRGGRTLLHALVGDGAEEVPVQGAFDRALLRALVHDNDGFSVVRLFEYHRTCSQPTPSSTPHDNGPLTLGDLLGLVQCLSSQADLKGQLQLLLHRYTSLP
ncbi:hypothetical protein BJV77DRAFT_1070744 [Russula vinacea]|nr:hypothetical protein BJV77DRAFT_1070744 [Russula vinacea]